MFGLVEVGIYKNVIVARLGCFGHVSLLKYRSREWAVRNKNWQTPTTYFLV
jgi:hypothetical protein